ncbi:MAG: hypothetical protein Q8P19_02735 [bacterium]|nr:hypothetical protein [bacterium]
MIPLQIPSQRVYILSGVAVVALSSMILFSHYTSALSSATGAKAEAVTSSSGTVYLSPSASAAAAASTQEQPMLEVHIANNGLTLLRGARVLSISGTTIRVGMAWQSSTFTWTLETNYNTRFVAQSGEKATLADITTGDVVMVTGTLRAGGSEPAIDTDYLRQTGE